MDNALAGCGRLIETLDRAVAPGRAPEAITQDIHDGLCFLIRRRLLALPTALCQPAPDAYARRLIHRDPQGAYTAVAMVWGPGQGTPIHDHAGMWCVEGVVQGRIEVTQYELLETKGGLFRFENRGVVAAGIGSAGTLIPPFDYHTIANAMPQGSAVTVHIYGGEMNHCHTFEPFRDDWYLKHRRTLSYTAAA